MMFFLSFFSRWPMVRRLNIFLLIFVLSSVWDRAQAHPMPNSMVLLDIKPAGVRAELQLPLNELQPVFGYELNYDTENLIARLGPQLRAYIIEHIRPVSPDQRTWTVKVGDMIVQPVEQSASGPYQELMVSLWLQPPAGESSRTFTLHYDVIIHQVVTHIALVSIRQDWENGVYAEHPVQVGVIRLDVPTGIIPPLTIDQASGSLWHGFQSMVGLGERHIAEGTDHLLFLLVLLLPAPLLWERRRWKGFGGAKYSIIRLLKVVSAFTIGHSLTLLAGAVGWVRLPGQPVEILIAISILVSAIHAIRPLFPGRETLIAAGFGLVHGLAFAATLAQLHLDSGRMALSILGFNMGIELMQLFVIVLTIPWLILLSRTSAYTVVRVTGAIFAAVASLAWITERLLNKVNPLTMFVERVAQWAPWLIGLLACFALLSWWWELRNKLVDLLGK